MHIKTNTFKATLLGLIMTFGLMISCTQKPETESEVIQITETVTVTDPLPSWNHTKTKEAIINFVEDVTNKDGENFIPVADRIATFDNDGTLWSEQPVYFQFYFAVDRVKAMAPDHPEWKTKQPFKAVLENDRSALMKQGEKGIVEIVMATHAGSTTDEFEKLVTDWVATAQHPTKKKLFTELVYQPMLELLDYLRANDFKTFIVSGGGIEFMRPWTEAIYNIPRNQVVGSSIQTKYEYNDGEPYIQRLAELDLNDDKESQSASIDI